MKLALLLVSSVLLTGCVTVPVTAKFPDAPPELMKACAELKQIPQEKSAINDVLAVVVENYTLYHECSNRVEGWQKWHKEQKQTFDKAGKR